MDHVKDAVIQVIATQLGVHEDTLKMHDSVRDLNADSLDIIEITMGIEEALNIEISDREIEETETISDIVALVEKKLI